MLPFLISIAVGFVVGYTWGFFFMKKNYLPKKMEEEKVIYLDGVPHPYSNIYRKGFETLETIVDKVAQVKNYEEMEALKKEVKGEIIKPNTAVVDLLKEGFDKELSIGDVIKDDI